MKKQMKILFGGLGVIAVAGIMAGAVVSCTSKNTDSTNDSNISSSSDKESHPTAYNNLGDPIKNTNNTSWTIDSATSYFTNIWNKLSSTQQITELKQAMDNNVLYFEQLFNSTSYKNTSKYPTTIDVELSNGTDATANMSYDTTFTFSNVNIMSPSNATFTMVLTTNASAVVNGTTYKDFFSTTADLTYNDASFIPGVAKAGVSINGITSNDYYAQLITNGFSSANFNQTPASTSTLSNPTDLLATALLGKGWGKESQTITYKDASQSALPHFIYVGTYDGSVGINFGPISTSISDTSSIVIKQ